MAAFLLFGRFSDNSQWALAPFGSTGNISVYSAYTLAPNKKEAESSLNFKALFISQTWTCMRMASFLVITWEDEQESSQMTLFKY